LDCGNAGAEAAKNTKPSLGTRVISHGAAGSVALWFSRVYSMAMRSRSASVQKRLRTA
jgi:hypothetical protein